MFEDQMQSGMEWVESRLSLLCDGQRCSVNSLGWKADTLSVQDPRQTLVLLLNGRIEVVTFDDADLEELPHDPQLQLHVEGELRALLNDELRGTPLLA